MMNARGKSLKYGGEHLEEDKRETHFKLMRLSVAWGRAWWCGMMRYKAKTCYQPKLSLYM